MATGEDPRWLTPAEQRAWRAFIVGAELLLAQLDRELAEEHGLSLSEYEILVRLSETEDGRLRMAVLASSISHSRSRMTHTVARMERAGLVRRVASATDGRGVEAVMTELGRARLVEAAPDHVEGVRRHLLDLASSGDFAALGRVFDAVCDQLLADKPGAADIR